MTLGWRGQYRVGGWRERGSPPTTYSGGGPLLLMELTDVPRSTQSPRSS